MTTNSAQKLAELKEFLDANGFSYESHGSYGTVALSLEFEAEPFELPDELKGFAPADSELERLIWKGNTEKKSYSGAELEWAISGWLHKQLSLDPRSVVLEADLEELLALPANTDEQRAHNRTRIEAYEQGRQEIWDELRASSPAREWLELLENFD